MFLKLSSARAALVRVAAICAVALGAEATQTANADVITSTTVTIWNAATPGATSTSASQQGLPTAVGLFGGPLPLVAASVPFAFAINYNDTALNTIPGFFASDTPPPPFPPGTCLSTACLTNPLSLSGFAQATVFRFTFMESTTEIFSVTHDDGVSLFVAGTETTTCTIANCPGDLLPTSAAVPQIVGSPTSVTIGPGTFDLWFADVNGLPAVLEATSTVVPLPGALPLFATGLVGLVLLGWRRKKAAAS